MILYSAEVGSVLTQCGCERTDVIITLAGNVSVCGFCVVIESLLQYYRDLHFRIL